jgi:hypothetical protein
VTKKFFSTASRAPRVKPGDVPGSIGLTRSPDDAMTIGIASEVGRIGGYDWDADEDLGPVEAVWRQVVDGEPVEGRFALRGGAFVELAERAGQGGGISPPRSP